MIQQPNTRLEMLPSEAMDADDARVLALAVIADALADAKRGEADAREFLMTENDDLAFWATLADLELDILWPVLARRLAA